LATGQSGEFSRIPGWLESFWNSAAAEFQKIVDHPGLMVNSPVGALAKLGLARAYALMGDKDKSRTAYQDFLGLWKNADSEVPVLKEAKAEYAKL